MNIGFLGLGKLGLPVSLAVEDKGHKVFGYDISEQTINAASSPFLCNTGVKKVSKWYPSPSSISSFLTSSASATDSIPLRVFL